jgi:predicted GNAT family acetyltransferase
MAGVVDVMGTTISDNAAVRRYEITVDGKLAGIAAYERDGQRIDFTHTQTLPPYAGRGLGAALVLHALDEARAQGLRVRPSCWFVRDVIAKYPDEYLSLVPADERPTFGL